MEEAQQHIKTPTINPFKTAIRKSNNKITFESNLPYYIQNNTKYITQ